MRVCIGMTAAGAGLLLAIGITATHVPAGAATFTHRPGSGAAAIVAGTGHAAAHAVTVSQAIRAGHAAAQAAAGAPFGRDGKPAGGALPVRESLAPRARPAAASTPTTRANLGRPTGAAAREMRADRVVRPLSSTSPSDFSGITEGGSDCTTCTTPDVSAAVSTTEIAETVNLSLQVHSKSTAATDCTVSLASLFGALTALSHPRIQYDNANNRFSLLADSVPGSSSDVPIQYLAASQTSDACGAWWVYSLTFPYSSLYPFGATLNYPYLGQDSTSILSSTNNYNYAGSYLGSAAYAMPKSAAYSGAGFSFTTYSVAFSTAPVTVAGIPTFSTTKTYWLAAVPGTGYDLYSMTTNPVGAISLQAVIKSSFTAPTRRVNQPGTSQTLDPLDGRIESAPVQDGSYVWFAHSVDDQGFPTIRYGAIDVSNDQITWGLAYHSSTSDDFNPSIGITDAGGGTNYIWLNWAYTDTPNGVPVSDTAAGVAPGDGVPDVYGEDLTLVTGSSTGSITTFGGYSSTEIDPSGTSSCPAGLTALTAQEYFTGSGSWTTRLARTTFC